MGQAQGSKIRQELDGGKIEFLSSTRGNLWEVGTAKAQLRSTVLAPTLTPQESEQYPVGSSESPLTPVVLFQLNTEHASFCASLTVPQRIADNTGDDSFNGTSSFASSARSKGYQLKYNMTRTAAQAGEWVMTKKHPNLLPIGNVIVDQQAVVFVCRAKKIVPVTTILHTLTSSEILYGLLSIANVIQFLHSEGMTHKCINWNSIYVLSSSRQQHWLLGDLHFLGPHMQLTGDTVTSTQQAFLRDLLSELRGLREAKHLPYISPEMNNPFSVIPPRFSSSSDMDVAYVSVADALGGSPQRTAAPSETNSQSSSNTGGGEADAAKSISLTASDVYAFGVMIEMVLPREGGASARFPTLGGFLHGQSNLRGHAMGLRDDCEPRAIVDNCLRVFANQCTTPSGLKRPQLSAFAKLPAIRESTFVSVMSFCDNIVSVSSYERMLFFWSLHYELVKLPMELLKNRILPRLLIPALLEESTAELFFRHLFKPVDVNKLVTHVSRQGRHHQSVDQAVDSIGSSATSSRHNRSSSEMDLIVSRLFPASIRPDSLLDYHSSEFIQEEKKGMYTLLGKLAEGFSEEGGDKHHHQPEKAGGGCSVSTFEQLVQDHMLPPVWGILPSPEFESIVAPFIQMCIAAMPSSSSSSNSSSGSLCFARCVLLRHIDSFVTVMDFLMVQQDVVPFVITSLKSPEHQIVLEALRALLSISMFVLRAVVNEEVRLEEVMNGQSTDFSASSSIISSEQNQQQQGGGGESGPTVVIQPIGLDQQDDRDGSSTNETTKNVQEDLTETGGRRPSMSKDERASAAEQVCGDLPRQLIGAYERQVFLLAAADKNYHVRVLALKVALRAFAATMMMRSSNYPDGIPKSSAADRGGSSSSSISRFFRRDRALGAICRSVFQCAQQVSQLEQPMDGNSAESVLCSWTGIPKVGQDMSQDRNQLQVQRDALVQSSLSKILCRFLLDQISFMIGSFSTTNIRTATTCVETSQDTSTKYSDINNQHEGDVLSSWSPCAFTAAELSMDIIPVLHAVVKHLSPLVIVQRQKARDASMGNALSSDMKKGALVGGDSRSSVSTDPRHTIEEETPKRKYSATESSSPTPSNPLRAEPPENRKQETLGVSDNEVQVSVFEHSEGRNPSSSEEKESAASPNPEEVVCNQQKQENAMIGNSSSQTFIDLLSVCPQRLQSLILKGDMFSVDHLSILMKRGADKEKNLPGETISDKEEATESNVVAGKQKKGATPRNNDEYTDSTVETGGGGAVSNSTFALASRTGDVNNDGNHKKDHYDDSSSSSTIRETVDRGTGAKTETTSTSTGGIRNDNSAEILRFLVDEYCSTRALCDKAFELLDRIFTRIETTKATTGASPTPQEVNQDQKIGSRMMCNSDHSQPFLSLSTAQPFRSRAVMSAEEALSLPAAKWSSRHSIGGGPANNCQLSDANDKWYYTEDVPLWRCTSRRNFLNLIHVGARRETEKIHDIEKAKRLNNKASIECNSNSDVYYLPKFNMADYDGAWNYAPLFSIGKLSEKQCQGYRGSTHPLASFLPTRRNPVLAHHAPSSSAAADQKQQQTMKTAGVTGLETTSSNKPKTKMQRRMQSLAAVELQLQKDSSSSGIEKTQEASSTTKRKTTQRVSLSAFEETIGSAHQSQQQQQQQDKVDVDADSKSTTVNSRTVSTVSDDNPVHQPQRQGSFASASMVKSQQNSRDSMDQHMEVCSIGSSSPEGTTTSPLHTSKIQKAVPRRRQAQQIGSSQQLSPTQKGVIGKNSTKKTLPDIDL